MSQTKEVKYVLISENKEGSSVIHREAICHIAYATALDALGVSSYLTSEQIRKYTARKTKLVQNGDDLELEVHIPIKRDINIYELMRNAQKDIKQNFADFLSLNVNKINLVVDQVFF